MKLTGYPSKLLLWSKKLMIDEYRLHIKAFKNRSEMEEGKEGNYNSSRKKKNHNDFCYFAQQVKAQPW